MHDSIVKLYNATGGNATEYDGTGIRHGDNITGDKATDTGTGGKTTDNLTGGKATDNVTRYDGILLNLSKYLMRLIRYGKKKPLAFFDSSFGEKIYRF